MLEGMTSETKVQKFSGANDLQNFRADGTSEPVKREVQNDQPRRRTEIGDGIRETIHGIFSMPF